MILQNSVRQYAIKLFNDYVVNHDYPSHKSEKDCFEILKHTIEVYELLRSLVKDDIKGITNENESISGYVIEKSV